MKSEKKMTKTRSKSIGAGRWLVCLILKMKESDGEILNIRVGREGGCVEERWKQGIDGGVHFFDGRYILIVKIMSWLANKTWHIFIR